MSDSYVEDGYEEDDADAIEHEDEGDRDWEAEARAMGWHPPAGDGVDASDAYRGGRENLLGAREFVEQAERSMPVLRSQLRRQNQRLIDAAEKIDGLTKTAGEQAEAIAELRALAKRADQAGYDRALADIEAEKREAVANADEEAYDQAVEREKALKDARAKDTAAATAPPAPPTKVASDPDIAAFERANASWWNKDETLSRAMIAHHALIIARSPGMPLKEQLAQALRRLKEDFPEKFGLQAARPDDDPGNDEDEDEEEAPVSRRPQRPAAAPALPPSSGAPRAPRRRNDPFDAIEDPQERAEARGAFSRIQRGDPTYTAEDYMAVYNNPHGDELTRIQRKKASAPR